MKLASKRDLRDGKPVWLASSPRIKTSQDLSAKQADVVIVGTGVSGALMADALQRAGYGVLAVDRRKIMSGSTPASTALLQSELDIPLTTLQKKMGASQAARAWHRSAEAVLDLQARIEDLGIDCEMRARETIYLPGNILNLNGLQKECAARDNIGLRSHYIGASALYKFSGLRKAGAIITRGNAELNPVKLVSGLWRQFMARGGRLASNTEVANVEQTHWRVRLDLADGRHLFAKHVVFCTGYEAPTSIRPKGYKIKSTWVLATKPQPNKLWASQSLIWEAADPYLYLRSTADGRIIVGGEDEDFSDEVTRNAMTPNKIASIARKARKLIPHADFSPEFSWTGCFGESPSGLPAIGPVPGMPRCYAVLGFGGNGITFSMLAAQLISRHIQGLKDPDAELFRL